MDDLIAFIRAQLDEDEQVARAGSEPGGPHWPNSDYETRSPQLEHARRHDPARVLAEVEAKRRMLDELYPEVKGADEVIEGEWNSSPWNSDTLLMMLALPYAGRPGYKEKWRP